MEASKETGRVGDVELVDVDAVEAEALEAAFDGLLNVRGAGVVLPDAGAVARPADLGGDDEVFGVGVERFGDELFRDVGAVGVGGVNKVDAQLDGAAQGGERGVGVVGRSPDSLAGDAHGAVAHAVHGQIAAEGDGSGLGGRQGCRCGRHWAAPLEL